jgi:uracil-DNA glycosylase family 4
MFTGDRSGDFLFSALHKAGYATQPDATSNDDGMKLVDAYITAPVRCAPPQNKPTAEEQKTCSDYLKREFTYLNNVKVILALGSIGYIAISKELNISPRPKFAHGLEVELESGEMVLCSYHVSQQNTFTGRLTEEMFDAVLERAKELTRKKLTKR